MRILDRKLPGLRIATGSICIQSYRDNYRDTGMITTRGRRRAHEFPRKIDLAEVTRVAKFRILGPQPEARPGRHSFFGFPASPRTSARSLPRRTPRHGLLLPDKRETAGCYLGDSVCFILPVRDCGAAGSACGRDRWLDRA